MYLLHCYILHIYHYVPVYRQHLVTLGFFYCKCLSFPQDFSCFSVDIGSMEDLGVFIIPNQHKNNSLCLYFNFDFELSFSFSSHYFFFANFFIQLTRFYCQIFQLSGPVCSKSLLNLICWFLQRNFEHWSYFYVS